MALDSTKTGDTIAAFVQSQAPVSGYPVTPDQIKAMWEGIMNIIYTDLKADGVIIGTDAGIVTTGPGSGGNVTITAGKIT